MTEANAAEPPPQSPRPGVPSPGAAGRCLHCGLWDNGPDDIYCGFCGHLQLPLSVTPNPLILISGIIRERDLKLTNGGNLPMRAVLAPTTLPIPGLLLEPAGPLEIPAGGTVQITARLDEKRLPADLRERTLRYKCVVDDDVHKVLDVQVIVRSGPKPQLLTPALQFGEVRDGSRSERLLEIANAGGTPFQVQSVLPEGSSQLLLGKGITLPAKVDPGGKAAFPVVWDAAVEETGKDREKAGVRVTFSNNLAPAFVPARARLYQVLLALDRTRIQIPAALSGHDFFETVRLENRGSIDVEITGIESDQPWIEVIGPTRSFTLLCSGSKVPTGPAAFPGTVRFTVICRPRDLPAGSHVGRVKIWPAGLDPRVVEIELNVVRPTEYSEYIGIDFGTTNSVVAVVNAQQGVDLVEIGTSPATRSSLIPSVLAFLDGPRRKDGPLYYKVGHEARNEAAPDRVVRSIKRIMGYDHERVFFGKAFKPEELAHLIIRRLVEMAEIHLHEKTGIYYAVRKAIITVPANFFDLQIRGVLQACALAGLDTEEEQVHQAASALRETLGEEVNAGIILDEPSAAVLYYLSHLEERDRNGALIREIEKDGGLNILVFDYGGGTLDVSVANIVRLPQGAAGLRILANMGNNRIGGDSIDVLAMRELARRCKLESKEFDASLIASDFKKVESRRHMEKWNDDVWARVLGARGTWKDIAERVKIDLSGKEEVKVEVPPHIILWIEKGSARTAPSSFKTTFRRSDLDDQIQGTLVECADLVRSALRLAQVSPEAIHYILHTGRQSLLPSIRDSVRKVFPKLPPERDLLEHKHLKVCVAQGAALYGLMRGKILDPTAGIHFLNEGRRLPHSYGVDKRVGLTRLELDEIIARGAAYPTQAERHYDESMTKASGGRLHLKFYQNVGTSKTIAGNSDIRQIGQITADARVDGQPGCHVRFVIDANRKLDVFVNGDEVPIQAARIPDDEAWMG